MENLTARARPYALYFPSLQIGSAESLVMTAAQWQSSPLPAGLQPADFNYLEPQNRFWTYGYALASAEVFRTSNRNAVTNRDPCSFILGDSGGFQFGKGTGTTKNFTGLPEPDVCAAWRNSGILQDVTSWCDTDVDYAMTLDLPLWVLRTGNNSPFAACTATTLRDLTIEHLQYVERRRKAGMAGSKYLNVLQGDPVADEDWWYDGVKEFMFDGWSLAGGVGTDGGPYRIIRRLLLLRDEGRLSHGRNWVHLLKQTRLLWAPFLTALQRGLRRCLGDEAFTISFDSSTPYQIGGKHEKYVEAPLLTTDPATWMFNYHKFPTTYGYANEAVAMSLSATSCSPTKCGLCSQGKPHLPAAMTSPITNLLTIQDLLPRKGTFDKRRVGKLFEETIFNHNVYTTVEAICRANEVVDKCQAPPQLVDAIGKVGEILRTQDWMTKLDANRRLLEKALAFSATKHVL